jgi:hypothetical protein
VSRGLNEADKWNASLDILLTNQNAARMVSTNDLIVTGGAGVRIIHDKNGDSSATG